MSTPISQGPGSNGFAVARNLNPKFVPVSTLKALGRETRKHPPAQVRKLAESLDRFGFVLPIRRVRCRPHHDRNHLTFTKKTPQSPTQLTSRSTK
jgi:hypothetical protein